MPKSFEKLSESVLDESDSSHSDSGIVNASDNLSLEISKDVHNEPTETGITDELDNLFTKITNHKDWSEDDIKHIDEYLDYHAKCLTYLNNIKSEGRGTKRSYPKQPNIAIKSILAKKGKKAKKKARTSAKEKLQNISSMADEEFVKYLESLQVTNVAEQNEEIMSTKDLESMRSYLCATFSKIKNKESELMREHLKFGSDLKVAHYRFNQLKKGTKDKQTWEHWIKENIPISYSYACQLMRMSELAMEYPKLKELQISYTDLFKMKDKIKDVFRRRYDLSIYWKNKE